MPSESFQLIVSAVLAAAPWCLAAPFLALRIRGTPSLANLDALDASSLAPGTIPRVSIVVPARNEAAHIGDCVRSILASTWPDLEVLVVDDHSTDGTGRLAREAAEGDTRLSVIEAAELPAGWFGKQ